MTFPAFKDKRYYPEEVDVVVGTIDAGDRFSLREDDADILGISEIAGVLPTGGFDIIFTFKRVLAPKNTKKLKLEVVGWYEGNAVHEVKLYVWDYDADAWVACTADLKDLPDETEEKTYTFEFEGFTDGNPSDEKLKGGTGEVKIRVIHNDTGNATHNMFFNKVSLGFSAFESTPR